MESIINRNVRLSKSQKNDLVIKMFNNVKEDSLIHGNLVLGLYKVFFSYKTPYNLLKRLSSDSKTIRKNTRNYIDTYYNDFIRYKTVNVKKIEEYRKNDDDPPERPTILVKRAHHKKRLVIKKDLVTRISELPLDLVKLIFSFEHRDRDMKSITASIMKKAESIYNNVNRERHICDILKNGFNNDYIPALDIHTIRYILKARNYFITFAKNECRTSKEYNRLRSYFGPSISFFSSCNCSVMPNRYEGVVPSEFVRDIENHYYEKIHDKNINKMQIRELDFDIIYPYK